MKMTRMFGIAMAMLLCAGVAQAYCYTFDVSGAYWSEFLQGGQGGVPGNTIHSDGHYVDSFFDVFFEIDGELEGTELLPPVPNEPPTYETLYAPTWLYVYGTDLVTGAPIDCMVETVAVNVSQHDPASGALTFELSGSGQCMYNPDCWVEFYGFYEGTPWLEPLNDVDWLMGGVLTEAYVTICCEPIPEPATVGLFGLGLVGLCVRRFRKRG